MKLSYFIAAILLIVAFAFFNFNDILNFTGLSVSADAGCESKTNNPERNKCYVDLAKSVMDAKYCDFLEKQDKSYNYCIFSVSELNHDVSLCRTIQDDTNWGDLCYWRYAEYSGEASFCYKLSLINEKNECFYNIALDKENVEICNKIPENYNLNQKCIYELAKETENVEFCELLKSSASRDVCFIAIAEIKQDRSICASIKSNLIKEDCESRLGRNIIN